MFSLISIWKYLLLVCLVISFLQVESHFNIALFGGGKKQKKEKQKKTSINVFLSRVFIICWKVLSENGLWLNRPAVQFWTRGWWENLSLHVMQHSSSNCKTFGPLLANDRLKSPIKQYLCFLRWHLLPSSKRLFSNTKDALVWEESPPFLTEWIFFKTIRSTLC